MENKLSLLNEINIILIARKIIYYQFFYMSLLFNIYLPVSKFLQYDKSYSKDNISQPHLSVGRNYFLS